MKGMTKSELVGLRADCIHALTEQEMLGSIVNHQWTRETLARVEQALAKLR